MKSEVEFDVLTSEGVNCWLQVAGCMLQVKLAGDCFTITVTTQTFTKMLPLLA